MYTLLDTLANCSLAFQRDLRHFLEPYLMLFLKHVQRLAHHRDKFVTRASRLPNTRVSQSASTANSKRKRTPPNTDRMTAPVYHV